MPVLVAALVPIVEGGSDSRIPILEFRFSKVGDDRFARRAADPHCLPVSEVAGRVRWVSFLKRERIVVDLDLEPEVIPASVLHAVFAHAREADPEECCGLITGDDTQRYRHAVRCRNDMTRHHRRDPVEFPRDGREGFFMNEQDYQQAAEAAEAEHARVVCVYHSHVGCGAWFSELDQEFAEQPHFPFPGAAHLVVSVLGGKVVDQALFERTEPRQGAGFVGRPVVHGPW
jgi:proteasome lid subunit RPN8/RPN11